MEENIPEYNPSLPPFQAENMSPKGDVSEKPPPPPPSLSRGIFASLTEAAAHLASSMRSPQPPSFEHFPPSAEEMSKRSQEDKRMETDGDLEAMVEDMPCVALDTAEKVKFKTDNFKNNPLSVDPSASDPILDNSAAGTKMMQGKEQIKVDEKSDMEETMIIEETEEFSSDDGNERSDVRDEDQIMAEKLKNIWHTADSLTEKRLGKDLDSALDELQKRVADALTAMKNERSNPIIDAEKRMNSNIIYANLRNSSFKAHKCLVEYGSVVDMSAREPDDDDHSINGDEFKENNPILGEDRRSKLMKFGKNLWIIVRSNPDLFNDIISRENGENNGGDESFISLFEEKKHQAVAGGYTRAIAARLVLLNYIDTRGRIGHPPSLRQHESLTSVKTLGFGLKTFCRAGRAILTYNKNDPRGAYDSLSLAKSCFNAIQTLSKTNGEAANELPGLVDEAFDVFFMLPNAASIFGSSSADKIGGIKWPSLVVSHLKQAETFLSEKCNTIASCDYGELRCEARKKPGSKFVMLQRYLPSLARLCYKHGSHFAKIENYNNANDALHIALKTTDNCLREVRLALEKEAVASGQDCKARGMHLQVLHNLEANLVVVSIESFYVLSFICQSTGKKEAAITCLDQIEKYLDEQQERDNKLFSDVMTNLNDRDGFVFSEESDSIDGPKKQDKSDIKSRAQTARILANGRHAKEQATLAFSRIMIFHKTLPSPTEEEEAFIDSKIRELVDLAWEYKNNPPIMHAISSADQISTDDNSSDSDHIFKITLQAIRVVHIRRILSKSANRSDCDLNPYKAITNKFQNTHRQPFILLDQLNAILTAQYKIRQDECDESSRSWLDKEAMKMAHEFMDIAKSTFQKSSSIDKGGRDCNSTLFIPRDQLFRNQLLQDTKIHFARAVSLYYASKDYKLCVHWSDLLYNVLKINSTQVSLEEEDALLNQVLSVKAFSQSMSGDEATAMKTAREAWETSKVKTVDGLVNLFHCGVRHEMKFSSGDTMLEFDNACNELLSARHQAAGVDEIISAFPRMSNSCVENEVGGGGSLLLSTQERWLSMLLRSSTFQENLKDRKNIEPPGGHSLFEILRAYLQNFEHIMSTRKDRNRVCQHSEALVRNLDGVLKLLCRVRERKQHKKSGRRKKKVSEFKLIWDDPATNKLLGDRADCVWTAEQLWNIGNLLMAEDTTSTIGVVRRFASDSFAASHDFCIFSEEEEGAILSKGYLNYDTKYNSENLSFPLFCGTNADKPFCDISSEFSAQCLLLSSATALDYASNCLDQPKCEAENRVRQALHRLSLAQDEFRVNCENEIQKKEVEKMIALLSLRALLGIGNDLLGADILQANGLSEALLDIHQEELGQPSGFSTLLNVKATSDLAEEKKMQITARILLRMCAKMLSLTGKFVLTVGHFDLSLGSIQRKLITIASSTKDVIAVYEDVDLAAKQHRDKGIEFYSEDELNWLIIEAYNRGVHLSLLGDFASSESLFSTGLNLLPLGGIELQCHAKEMRTALSNAVTNKLAAADPNYVVPGIG